jgi:hypothetical protein
MLQIKKDHPTFLLLYMDRGLWHPQCAGYVALALVTWRPVPGWRQELTSHIASMIAKTPKRRKASASNPLASALARWGSEGGASGPASELSRSVHKLAHAPKHLHDEIKADYNDMMHAKSADQILAKRESFLSKWKLRCPPVG